MGSLVGLEGVVKAEFSDNEANAVQTPGRRQKVQVNEACLLDCLCWVCTA